MEAARGATESSVYLGEYRPSPDGALRDHESDSPRLGGWPVVVQPEYVLRGTLPIDVYLDFRSCCSPFVQKLNYSSIFFLSKTCIRKA